MRAPSVSLLSWLRPEQIHVAFAGTTWQLQATTAADWLGAIAIDFEGLSGVFPGLVADDDLDDMSQLLLDPDLHEPMREVARKVVQAAGGRDWWWTVNLARRVMGQWIYINGFLVRQGIRADGIGLPDWLDACYTWLWEHRDENEKTVLDMELGMPPKGMKLDGTQVRKMLADFAAD